MSIHRYCAAAAVAVLCCSILVAAEKQAMTMKITSSAFQEGQPIPAKYTCDGENSSPPLKWSDAPAETKFFALICDDPDAPTGTWVHWVVYGLPATTTELAEKTAAADSLQSGGHQGVNDFRRTGYGGPCPPAGKLHHYHFKIYALDTESSLKPRATKKELLKAMGGHILGQGELVGTYQRKR
jgi:Raf kinase inhibitor-like YbhB/YbcL family protein